MSVTAAKLSISDAVKARLDELVEGLGKVLGDDLVSVVVHGSAVREEWREGHSDVDLVIVVRSDAPDRLRAMANPLQVARFAGRIEAMILVEGEIEHAADAFPLLYDDIKRCHVVLRGSDPFADLEIPMQHFVVRLEQELREAHIRLRRVVTDYGTDGGLLAGQLRRKVRQLRPPLRALVALGGVECGDALAEVYEKAGKTYGIDTSSLLDVADNPDLALTTLRSLLDRAVADADRRGSA